VATFVHLVRHGEVENPERIVYAGLPGFPLTERGRTQAQESADYLSSRLITRVWSSPLDRTMETAAPIAAGHGLDVSLDPAFAEWGLSDRWAGMHWEDIPDVERAAYFETPWRLPFSPESLSEMGQRMAQAIERAAEASQAEVVIVSHMDPIQAARLALLGLSKEHFVVDRPSHAEVITLAPSWREVQRWQPPTSSESFPPKTV